MRILMLAHRLPYPPRTGDRVRAFHVARHLARRHRLTLACPIEAGEGPAETRLRELIPDLVCAPIGRLGRAVAAAAALASAQPLALAYFRSRALGRRVEARLRGESFDLAYVSSSAMGQYVPAPGPPAIVDFVDVDSDKYAQYASGATRGWAALYRLEARRLARYEAWLGARARVSLFASPAEVGLFRAMAPDAPTRVVANGVDTDYFRPASAPPAWPPTVVFTGALDYLPNVDAVCHFADAVWPHVRRAVVGARFLAVGRRPSRAVRRLAGLPGVQVAGDVPDVRPWLCAAHVAVAPLRVGRGVQNKVLEAMAAGLPVVATPLPAQAIDAVPGREWFVEDSAVAFADRVATLLTDPAARRRTGAAARAFVERNHRWDRTLAALDALTDEIAERPAPVAVPG